MRLVLSAFLVALSALAPFASLRAATALPTPDPDDGAISLPPGFRALVVADNLVVGKRVGNTPEKFRGLAIAPNGNIKPAAVLPADREKFSNVMPPFSVLSDADIASVITYMRKNFAPSASAVTAAEVAQR